MEPLQAEKAIRNGAIGGVVSACITLVLAWSHWTTQGWEKNLDAIVGAVVLLLLAHAVSQRSVLGAALLLAVHLLNSAAIATEPDSARGLGAALLLAYIYLRALQGTRALLPPESETASTPLPWWAYYVLPSILATLVIWGLEH